MLIAEKFYQQILIQAQRDYFGSHTYERIDETGIFHTEWQPEAPTTGQVSGH